MAAPSSAQVREAALSFKPDEFHELLQQSGQNRFWIVVVDLHSGLGLHKPESFCWYKASAKTKLNKIYINTRGRCTETPDIVLKIDDNMVSMNGVVGDLHPPRDGILVMHAVKPEDVNPKSELFVAAGRPSTSQVTPTQSRPPLQPVSRQLSAVPLVSQDEASVKQERRLSPAVNPRLGLHNSSSLPATPPVPSLSPSPQVLSSTAAASSSDNPNNEHLHAATAAEPTPDAAADEPEPEYQPREQENLFVD